MTSYPARRTITEQGERIPRPVPTAICDLLHSPSQSPRTRPGENNFLALEEVTLAEPGLTTCPFCLWLWGCIDSKTQGPAQIFLETKKVMIALSKAGLDGHRLHRGIGRAVRAQCWRRVLSRERPRMQSFTSAGTGGSSWVREVMRALKCQVLCEHFSPIN